MRRLSLMGAVALGMAGCGSDGQQFQVSGLTLHAVDQLYLSRPTGTFCTFAAPGQINIKYFDYKPACPKDRQVDAPDPRDPGIEHSELDIIVGGFYPGGPHENLRDPFTLSKFDCNVGPGDLGTAFFYHYQPNSMTPDVTVQVDTGTLKLDQIDKATNTIAATGNFDLKFGGSELKGTINALDCD